MDGDGGSDWIPSPWCDVVISISALLLRLSICGAWGLIYIEAPSRKLLGLTWRRRWIPIRAPIWVGPARMGAR
jgi:hypothetical protein